MFWCLLFIHIYFWLGFQNDCGGETVEITRAVVKADDDDVEMEDANAKAKEECKILKPTSPNEAKNIGNLYSRAHKYRQNHGGPMCTPTDEISHDNAELNNMLEVTEDRIMELTGNNNFKYEWEQNLVTDDQIRLMREWQSEKLPVDEIAENENINTWFEYLPKRGLDGNFR